MLHPLAQAREEGKSSTHTLWGKPLRLLLSWRWVSMYEKSELVPEAPGASQL